MVDAVVDVRKYDDQLAAKLLGKFAHHQRGPHTLRVRGTFEVVEEFYNEFRQVVGHPVTSQLNILSERTDREEMESSPETMRVPLFHYWYLNHMYRKEIERIQEKHGVTFKADVRVSANNASETNHKSFTDATFEFQQLFRECANDIDSVSVANVDLLVKEIKNLDTKLMLNASAQNWCIIGPRDQVAAAKIMLNVPAKADDPKPEQSDRKHLNKTPNQNLHEDSRWRGPRGVEMDVKDSVLLNGLNISEIHWELMKTAFKKQIKDLENKFGVNLIETKTHDRVTITALSIGNQMANLEVNSLRALTSLYQKAVMKTMCCSSKNASHNQAVSFQKYLNDIREQNPCLVVRHESSSSGVWKMIGFPEHLCFAVSEIEKRVGVSVFDDKQKDMIGYAIRNSNADFRRQFTDEPEISKRYGSSVDGATSSDLYGENGLETRGTRRKETHGFGSHKEADTQGGFKGSSSDDRTAQPTADGGVTKEDDTCPICMDEFTNMEKLPCGHGFCKDCLRQSKESMGAKCPVCTKVFGRIEGDQPDGKMTTRIMGSSLPGFERCGTIVIDYNIPSGIQSVRGVVFSPLSLWYIFSF